MKELKEKEMSKVNGGTPCNFVNAMGGVTFSTMGVAAVGLGPVGWGAALLLGGAAIYFAYSCDPVALNQTSSSSSTLSKPSNNLIYTAY